MLGFDADGMYLLQTCMKYWWNCYRNSLKGMRRVKWTKIHWIQICWKSKHDIHTTEIYTKIYCERKSRNRMNEWTNSKREWIKQCDRLVDHACKKANISVIVHFGAQNLFIWYAHVWHDYVKGKALKFGFHVTSYIRLSIGSRNQLTATIKWFY